MALRLRLASKPNRIIRSNGKVPMAINAKVVYAKLYSVERMQRPVPLSK
jgi:hypothetical protein